MESRKLLLIVALAAMVVIGTGCDWESCKGTAAGGGWIYGVDCESKATIGFVIQKDGRCATGQVQYNDRSECGVMFHGVVESVEKVGFFSPTYWACGKATIMPGKQCVTFKICVEDNGEPGDEDFVKVKLYKGRKCCYENEGCLHGGNVQIIEEDDD